MSTQSEVSSENFQALIDQGPILKPDRVFLINGWRWHTSSVIRDLKRFQDVVQKTEKSKNIEASRIVRCSEFVVGFNWKALMRVEREIFFPWLENMLPVSARSLFSDVYQNHNIIQKLSESLVSECLSCSNDFGALQRVDKILSEMLICASNIQTIQENNFIPYISAYVSRKEQERFNHKVIKKLGLLDSQIHLVSMLEAIAGNSVEEALFRTNIPKVARLLIPVWKKRLYAPKADCLL